MVAAKSAPLFRYYPNLSNRLPHISLGEFPTPVDRLINLGAGGGTEALYIKREDLSGKVYGGNKIRKLEFLLAEALSSGAKEVLTFGAAGSNHCLATAICSRKLGIKSISMLVPQPNARTISRNLLMSYHEGAELHHYSNSFLVNLGTRYQLLKHRIKTGRFPYVIPPGGSSPTGVLGTVNAAFELKEQIKEGVMPEPDRIYVAFSTMGTAIGLILGLIAAELKSRVICVRTAEKNLVTESKMGALFNRTSAWLHSLDANFPDLRYSKMSFEINDDFFGEKYGLFTREAVSAIKLMKEKEGITLEGTYTGKTLAALLADLKKRDFKNKVFLFWNTFNSRDFSGAISDIDYHRLPPGFHRYFEETVQPLDKES